MSWQPPARPDAHGPAPAGPDRCALCGATVPAAVTAGAGAEVPRCPACGLYQGLGPARPNPFSGGRAVGIILGSLAVVYGLTYLAVWAQ